MYPNDETFAPNNVEHTWNNISTDQIAMPLKIIVPQIVSETKVAEMHRNCYCRGASREKNARKSMKFSCCVYSLRKNVTEMYVLDTHRLVDFHC